MLDRRSSSACKSPNLYVGICSAPKYCNKSRMSSSCDYLLQYLFKYTLSPEPLKNPPRRPADCCSAVEQPMLQQRAPDYGAQGPQLLPTTPHFPLPTLWIFHASVELTSWPFFLAQLHLFPLSAQTHPTPLFESTPVFGGTGSASTWRGAGSPVNAWLKAGTGTGTPTTTTHWHSAGRNGTLAHVAQNQHLGALETHVFQLVHTSAWAWSFMYRVSQKKPSLSEISCGNTGCGVFKRGIQN